jgi:hypothetical protein
MDFADNWPLLLVALAAFMIVASVLRRIARMAFAGVALAAIGLFLWPMVSSSL